MQSSVILHETSHLLTLGYPYRTVMYLSNIRLLGTIVAASHFDVQYRKKRRKGATFTSTVWHRLPSTMARCNSLLPLH